MISLVPDVMIGHHEAEVTLVNKFSYENEVEQYL